MLGTEHIKTCSCLGAPMTTSGKCPRRVGVRRGWMLLASGWGAILLVTIWLASAGRWQGTPTSVCEQVVKAGDSRHGLQLCHAVFSLTGDHRNLVGAAKAHLYLGEYQEAEAHGQRLVEGPLRGEGYGILSYCALRERNIWLARWYAFTGIREYLLKGDVPGLADGYLAFAKVAWVAGDFDPALESSTLSLEIARELRDNRRIVAASMTLADVLRRIGDYTGAAALLADANGMASTACERAWLRLKSGLCQLEAGSPVLGKLEFDLAEKANRTCGSRDVSGAVTISLAWALRRIDPAAALAKLEEFSRTRKDVVETLLLRVYLAADRGNLTEAEKSLARAEALEPPHADWPWEVAHARAELFEERGGLLGNVLAELHYRRATAMVAALRANARVRAASLVTSHRAPYDGLILLLARQGRWRDVLQVMLQLDASDMLRATAESGVVPSDLRIDSDTPNTPSPVARIPSVDDLLQAWRQRDLVIVIAPTSRRMGPDSSEVVRLRVREGRLVGELLGRSADARRWANDLYFDPGDAEAASRLGELIAVSGPSEQILDVLAIGELGRVPLAALRDRDGTLSARRRAMARVLALWRRGRGSQGDEPPVVIANPRGDLPHATREGVLVAEAIGAQVRLTGAGTLTPSTKDVLWASSQAKLLHFAGHIGSVGKRRALLLADGEVGTEELIQRGLAPRLAVLAGCGSAAAMDEEGWGSVASALLEAGTEMVIATDRDVKDDHALELMRGFYAQGDWNTEPARALARVQAAMDEKNTEGGATKARDWAAFLALRRPPAVAGGP